MCELLCRRQYAEVKDDDLEERGDTSHVHLPEVNTNGSNARESTSDDYSYRNSEFVRYRSPPCNPDFMMAYTYLCSDIREPKIASQKTVASHVWLGKMQTLLFSSMHSILAGL